MEQKIFTQNRKAHLEYDNFVTVQYLWSDPSYIGQWRRNFADTAGYSYETFFEFDISSIIGSTIISTVLNVDCGQKGSQSSGQTGFVWANTGVPNSTWNGSGRAPKYNDFPIGVDLPTPLGSISGMLGIGTYQMTHLSGFPLHTVVQNWCDETTDWKDGLVLDLNYQAIPWWLRTDEFRLTVNYELPSSLQIIDHYIKQNNQ